MLTLGIQGTQRKLLDVLDSVRPLRNLSSITDGSTSLLVGMVLVVLTLGFDGVQGTQRKMLDVLNSVGLSDSVLRMIERRMKLDKLILYGGMVGHLAVFSTPVTLLCFNPP